MKTMSKRELRLLLALHLIYVWAGSSSESGSEAVLSHVSVVSSQRYGMYRICRISLTLLKFKIN